MASNKKHKEVRFTLTKDDYLSFGRYRIMYTDQGRKMVRRQRLTYIFSGIILAGLFTVFHVDKTFTYLMYVISAALVVAGAVFAEKMVIRQQDKAIEAAEGTAESLNRGENTVRFEEDNFTTIGGGDEQNFSYKDIKLLDLTEDAIYVWMSDTAIMPLPLHAFKGMNEMKDMYKELKEKSGL